MAVVKQLLPNQHTPLHLLYGQHDCCLCSEQLKVRQLKRRIEELERKLDRLDTEINASALEEAT